MTAPTAAPSVRLLAAVPEVRPVLARWYVETWAPWYGPGGPGDAAADLADATRRDGLPLGLVVLDAGGAPLGAVALRAASVASHAHLTPWLTALVVAPPFRGRGVGAALVAAAEREARRLGFPRLHTATDTAHRLVERRGWRALDRAPTLRGEVTVYALDLAGLPAP